MYWVPASLDQLNVIDRHPSKKDKKKQKKTETATREARATPLSRNGSRDVIDHVTIRFPICHFL